MFGKTDKYEALKKGVDESIKGLRQHMMDMFDIERKEFDQSIQRVHRYINHSMSLRDIQLAHMEDRIDILEKELDELKKAQG